MQTGKLDFFSSARISNPLSSLFYSKIDSFNEFPVAIVSYRLKPHS